MKTNQLWLDHHEIRFHHEQWAVWGVLKRRPKNEDLRPPGEEVLPYKGLMGTCSQPGYVFRDFCLKQGIDFIIFCLNQGIDCINFCLKLDCLQSAFSLKIRPDETRKDSL